jgi:hypothetical protein
MYLTLCSAVEADTPQCEINSVRSLLRKNNSYLENPRFVNSELQKVHYSTEVNYFVAW